MELASFTTGALAGAAIGAVASEFLKGLVGTAFKRASEKGESRRKSIREDVVKANDRADSCLEVALKYYTGLDVSKRPELATSVRHSVRTLGMQFNQVNQGLAFLGQKQLEPRFMVEFRQAVTMRLDENDFASFEASSPEVIQMYQSLNELKRALNQARYESS